MNTDMGSIFAQTWKGANLSYGISWRGLITKLKILISEFLKNRGLTLSEEKTKITNIDDGFDFLGWTFRKFKGKLIVKPSKTSIKAQISKCSDIILKVGKALSQSELIRKLNPVIRGRQIIIIMWYQAMPFPQLIMLYTFYCNSGQNTDTPIKAVFGG